jgi:hypothetical protein
MTDILCRKCGEPWDSYGITYARGEGDLTACEAVQFLKGHGCPACHWGQHCLRCAGSGKEPEEAPGCACRGRHTLIIRRLYGQQDPWQYGTIPEVQPFPGEPVLICRYPGGVCRDGRYDEALALCPFCASTALPCPDCGGTGRLPPLDGRTFDRALSSLVEASDEDITIYLMP